MKTLTILFVAFMASAVLSAQDMMEQENVKEETCTLIVNIEDLKSDKGTINVGLYSSEGTWLNKTYKGKDAKIKDGKATVTFENVPLGTYAISTYQDENENRKMDTGIFGIPSEPYMSSRGEKGRFGPPKWKNAKFELNSDSQTEIIKY